MHLVKTVSYALVCLNISLRFMACVMDLLWSNTADAIISPTPHTLRKKKTKPSRTNTQLQLFLLHSSKSSARKDKMWTSIKINLNFILSYCNLPLPVRIITSEKRQLVFLTFVIVNPDSSCSQNVGKNWSTKCWVNQSITSATPTLVTRIWRERSTAITTTMIED